LIHIDPIYGKSYDAQIIRLGERMRILAEVSWDNPREEVPDLVNRHLQLAGLELVLVPLALPNQLGVCLVGVGQHPDLVRPITRSVRRRRIRVEGCSVLSLSNHKQAVYLVQRIQTPIQAGCLVNLSSNKLNPLEVAYSATPIRSARIHNSNRPQRTHLVVLEQRNPSPRLVLVVPDLALLLRLLPVASVSLLKLLQQVDLRLASNLNSSKRNNPQEGSSGVEVSVCWHDSFSEELY
jgi:hypothetical protein